MKPLLKDDKGDVAIVGTAVAILVMLIISIVIVYNIAAGIDTTDLDADITANLPDVTDGAVGGVNTTFAANASRDILDQSETYFTIAPLIVIVMVAVAILGYVVMLGGRRE